MKTQHQFQPHGLEAVSITGINAFGTLNAEQRIDLVQKLARRDFQPGDTIISRAEKTTDVYFLISGWVRACSTSAEGKEIQFEDLSAGEMFGELAALDGGGRSGECVAVTASVVAAMSQSDFHQSLDQYTSFSRYVMKRLATVVRNQMDRVVEFSTHTIKDRLRCELVRLAVRQGEPSNGVILIHNAPTHADIAARIGTQREAVTKEMNRLVQLGMITWNRTEHYINDLQALKMSLVKFQHDDN